MKKSVVFAALAVLVSGSVLAGTPRYDARQQHQRERIVNGVQNGELTARETRRLAAGQVHLNRVERRAKADGVVTGRERAHMQHEANQQSRRIHRQKHDAQDRN
ncbi:MAG: hypothetical protein K0Q92_215 [Steroidobacteraceae bacterium]|jgi:hypothetical protein|nr:hypothetical protein [Steroidobacteraceae bacterium]